MSRGLYGTAAYFGAVSSPPVTAQVRITFCLIRIHSLLVCVYEVSCLSSCYCHGGTPDASDGFQFAWPFAAPKRRHPECRCRPPPRDSDVHYTGHTSVI